MISSEIALICEGLISQQPPKIVAPSSIKFLTTLKKFFSFKSLFIPNILFGLPSVPQLSADVTI